MDADHDQPVPLRFELGARAAKPTASRSPDAPASDPTARVFWAVLFLSLIASVVGGFFAF